MTKILIIFMGIILGLALVVALLAHVSGAGRGGDDPSLYDGGDHVYYDRSSIEKKEFGRRYPKIKGVRTFRRLFGNKPEDRL